MCPQQLDHKPQTTQPSSREPVVTGDHKKDARIHCAILNKHTTTTTTAGKHPHPATSGMPSLPGSNHHKKTPTHHNNHQPAVKQLLGCGLFSQDPTGCSPPPPAAPPTPLPPHPHQTRGQAVLDDQVTVAGRDSPVSPPTEHPHPTS